MLGVCDMFFIILNFVVIVIICREGSNSIVLVVLCYLVVGVVK